LFEDDSHGGIRLSHHSSDKLVEDDNSVDEQSLVNKLDTILAKNKQRQSEHMHQDSEQLWENIPLANKLSSIKSSNAFREDSSEAY
jgi:hypothetical protein